METFEVDKTVAKQIKWLLTGASSNEQHGTLQGIKIEEKKMYAADGFCLLSMDTPWQFEPYIGKILRLQIHDRSVIVVGEMEGNYPNIKAIMEPIEEPVFKITIADYLLEKLIMPGATQHHFTFYGTTKPFKVTATNLEVQLGGNIQEAWAMPMHSGKE